MKVRVLRQFLDGRVLAEPGDEIDVTEVRARQLMAHRIPLVTMTVGAEMKAPGAAKGGEVDPTPSPPPGGPTGAAEPASSPRRGRPPRASLLKSGEGVFGS